MVRRTAATSWFAVDILVLNRRFRCENDGSEEWSALEAWLRHQLAERQEMKARFQDAALISGAGRACKKRQQQTSALGKGAKARAHHPPAPTLNLPPIQTQLARPKSKSKGRRCKDSAVRPAATTTLLCYPHHHHEKFELIKSQRFMDRDYMQQIERRLVDQHEELIQQRIKQRQAEEAQRKRQLIQAGLIADPHKCPPLASECKRGASRSSNAAGKHHRATPQRSAKKPHLLPPSGTQQLPQQPLIVTPQRICITPCEAEEGVDDDETESLDEACPSEAAVRLVRRPRLAILLQACKAVVGAGQLSSKSEDEAAAAPAGRQQVQTQAAPPELLPGRLQHVEHYESPLIAKLRQVENLEEFYCLAEQIVAQTKL